MRVLILFCVVAEPCFDISIDKVYHNANEFLLLLLPTFSVETSFLYETAIYFYQMQQNVGIFKHKQSDFAFDIVSIDDRFVLLIFF